MKTRDLKSGYTVGVRGLGPFALDHISRRYPILPEVVRVIELATGDTGEWPYEPPATEPDRAADPEEWALWAKYKTTAYRNAELQKKAERERVEFFKVNCVDLLKTPFPSLFVWTIRAYKWILRLLGRPVLKVPMQRRYLLFLDTEVIRSVDDWIWMQSVALHEEVTMDGVLDAAVRSFRGNLRGQAAHLPDDHRPAAQRPDELQHADLGGAGGAGGGEDAG